MLTKTVLFFLLQTPGFVTAQVRFSASLIPSQIAKDEYTQLRLIVENATDVQQIDPPALAHFVTISGPNWEKGMNMVNGDVTRYVAVNYVIRPKGPGTFVIPPVTAKADGKILRSNPVSVHVTNASSGNNSPGSNNFFSPFSGLDPFAEPPAEFNYRDFVLHQGEDPADKIKKNMAVQVETDKPSCYVGEPVVATYKLYTRLKSESGMTKTPNFNGFSVIDLPDPNNLNYHTEKRNGRDYNVYVLRRAQLYPLQPGDLELESAEIENNVHFVKEAYFRKQQDLMSDMFRDLADAQVPPEGVINQKTTLVSNPLTIHVKSLPEAGKPADFKGAVGDFSIEAYLSKKNFTTDDACELTLIISGSGNLQLVNAPEMSWPADVEGFEPKIKDDLNKLAIPVSGRKIIIYPFTVTRPGSYSLPPLTFHYFDVKTVSYKTATTGALSFTVTRGTGKRSDKATDDSKSTDSFLNQFFSNRWRVVAAVAMLICCGLVFWFIRDKRKESNKAEPAPELLLQQHETVQAEPEKEAPFIRTDPLAEAKLCLQQGEPSAFYTALNQSLRQYLSGKLQIVPDELNRKSLLEDFDKRGVRNDIILQWQQLLDELEWQLYTPFSQQEKMPGMYERAEGLVSLLNSYIA